VTGEDENLPMTGQKRKGDPTEPTPFGGAKLYSQCKLTQIH